MQKIQEPRASSRKRLSPAQRVVQTYARRKQGIAESNQYLIGFTEELKQMANHCEESLDYSLKTITAIAKRTDSCDNLKNHYGLTQLIKEITEDVSKNYAEIDSIKRAIKNSTLGNLRRLGGDAISTLFNIFNRLTEIGDSVQNELLMPTLDCFEIIEQNDLIFPADSSARREINAMLDQFAELGDSLKNMKRSA